MKKCLRFSLTSLVLVALVSCTPSSKKDSAKPSANDPNAVVAKIGSETILAKELDDLIGEQVHQYKRQALEQMVYQRILKPKAKAAGKSIEAYIESEVFAKIPMPSEEEIKAMYDQAKPGNPSLPPLEKVRDQIVDSLQRQKRGGAVKTYLAQLMKDSKAEITLPEYQPARKDNVEAKGFLRGDEKAPVTIVEFSDYQCQYCAAAEPTIKRVLKEYAGKVRFFFRDFPLPNHSDAPKAAEAAHCAEAQGKLWEMHDKLFENQGALDVTALKGYAKALGLDTAKFDKCLDSGEKAAAVASNQDAAESLNVNSTPAFFVNGLPLKGAASFEKFKELIDAELAK